MPAQGPNTYHNAYNQMVQALQQGIVRLSQPRNAHRLRQCVLLLCLVWGSAAVARIVWSLVPGAHNAASPAVVVINPIVPSDGKSAVRAVDLDQMRSWHLFGTAAVVAEDEVAVEASQEADREGIEDGARETNLDLKLRGVLATADHGLGHAIIEHKSRQEVYSVEDVMPVGGKVTLAKVMRRQVVLNNNGTYELLPLYEDTVLDKQGAAAQRQKQQSKKPDRGARVVDKRDNAAAIAAAQDYRQRLYKNPQSLADVVRVAAVREDGQLKGYSVSPGKNQAQFEQFGLKRGDIVTSVNGITLDDPGNTMRLYQTMRTASEAVFEVERGGQQLSLSVSLNTEGAQ